MRPKDKMKLPWTTCSVTAAAYKGFAEVEPLPDNIEALKRINEERPMNKCRDAENFNLSDYEVEVGHRGEQRMTMEVSTDPNAGSRSCHRRL